MEFTQNALKLISDDYGMPASVEFHYYDCNCKECFDRHYPCDNVSECPYCITVNNIKYDRSQSTWRLPLDMSEVLPYSMYDAWSDEKKESNFDDDELLVTTCDRYMCETVISKYFANNFNGYCKEHYSEYLDEQGDYEEDDDQDDYEEDDDQDDSYDGRTFGSWDHEMGEVLNPSEYSHTTEAWIAPNGNVHFVPLYNDYGIGHYETAQALGLGSTDGAERRNYLHVSTYYDSTYPFRNTPNTITDEQIDSAMLLSDANGWEYPEFVQEWLDEHNQDDENDDSTVVCIEIAKMQNLSPSWLCMTRKERDLWYPLSGD